MTHIASTRNIQLVTAMGCLTMSLVLLSLSHQSVPPLQAYVSGGVTVNSPFHDAIPDWAQESILSLYKEGIIRGYDDGRYGAGDPVTRGQVATLLYRILRARNILTADPYGCEQAFDDVGVTHYAFVPLCVLKLDDLAQNAGHFAPDIPAPRAVTAAITVRTLGPTLLQSLNESIADVLAKGQAFPDVSLSSPYYQDIAVANETQIMTGYPNGRFGPEDSLNRAEAAVVMDRLLRWMDANHISSIQPDDNQHSAAPVNANGQCPGADLRTDPENCGWCGNFCAFDHAQATCIDGGCSIASCDFGWSNANYIPEDGCEEKWDGITPPPPAASSSARASSRSSAAARSSSSAAARSASPSSASALPDYTVENINAGPSGTPGGVIYQVTVGNRGNAVGTQTTQTSLEIWFNDDSHDVDELGVLSTPPVGTMSSRALFWTGHSIVLPGRHRIMACVNVFSAVSPVMPESNRQNNCAAIYATVSGASASSSSSSESLPSFLPHSSSSAGGAKSVMPTRSGSSAYSAPTQYHNSSSPMLQFLPNLSITDGMIGSESFIGMNDFLATVQNTGRSTAENFYVQLAVDKEDDGIYDDWSSKLAGTLAPGASQQLHWVNGLSHSDFVWVRGPQRTRFRICADSINVILESNERDNCTEFVYDPNDIQ